MKRVVWLLALLGLTTVACNHKQPSQAGAESSRAPVSNQTPATSSVPVYPRAQLVALPPTTNIAPAVSDTPSISPTTASSAPAAAPPQPESTNATPPPLGLDGATPGATASTVSAADSSSPISTPLPSPVTAATDTNAPSTAVVVPNDVPTAPLGATTDDLQVVVLQTTFGRMVLQLDDFAAPKTCANFRNLVSSGFYNGTIFHRVIPNFVIQGGDPNSKTDNRATYGQGDPGYTLPAEIKLSHDRGAVAMARLPDPVNPGRDSNGSQFYICVEACPSLDDQYTVFAHVIQGMDVAERIAKVPRDKRDDPLVRIAMDARLEPKSQAMQDIPLVTH